MTMTHLQLRSHIPGRMRWQTDKLRGQPRYAKAVELTLQRLDYFNSVTINPRTGRILLHYTSQLAPTEIETHLMAALETPPLTRDDDLALSSHEAECGDSCGHDHHHHDPSAHIFNLTIGGVVLAGIGLKRLIFGATALTGNPLLIGVSTVATLISGHPFLRGLWRSITGRTGINTDTLVGSATLASLVLRENITALTVIWLLNLGEYLQALTLQRTEQAIRDLLRLESDDVWLVLEESEIKVNLSSIKPGDRVAVHSGHRLPVDGKIVMGQATLNQAPITGESMPVIKNVGDEVFAGTIILSGEVRVLVERVGDETAVGRLIQRVEEAQELRAPIQTIGDKFSERFVPFSFALAGLIFVVTWDVHRALTMLLIACPCASGLATPTAVSAAIGNGARRGVLIKGGTHLEAAANLDTVVFDKTGTLTLGLPSVQRVISLVDDYTADQVLSLAATGELHSQHPLALAVVNYAQDRELLIPPHESCEILVGRGMRAEWPENHILVGNSNLLTGFNIVISPQAEARYLEYAQVGETMMYVAHQNRLIGLIGVRDKVRPSAAQAMNDLRRIGIKHLLMLTGDGNEAAESVAYIVGLTEWQAQLLPEQKYDIIRNLQLEGRCVAMVGDGINDAPALALANVGLAMGTAGSDVAIEAADIALAANDIHGVVTTVRLSRHTLRIIRQNYVMALGLNAGGVVIGAMGGINPLVAAILHNLSTLLVVFNSARLIGYNPEK